MVIKLCEVSDWIISNRFCNVESFGEVILKIM